MTEVPQTTTEQRDIELSDIMLAMDVVDTLRHRQSLVQRELDSDAQEAALIEKVKGIYASQGIEVSSTVISEAVQALKEKRFSYSPPPLGFKTKLATWYVDRGRWFKRLIGLAVAATFIWGLHYGFVGLPKQREVAALQAIPDKLDTLRNQAVQLAQVDSAKLTAERLYQDGAAAAGRGETDAANRAQAALLELMDTLRLEYQVEVIYRPGESSGVWRIPPNNEDARNYYLIVEARSPAGAVVRVPVTSEEDNTTRTVSKWGIRVSESVFNRMRADKQDDGIIQNNKVGSKRRGHLEAEYSVDTTGAAITEW